METATLREELFANGIATVPDGLPLVAFSFPTITDTISDVIFTPTSPFILSPSTTYWLVAAGFSDETIGPDWCASSPRITPTGIASSAGYRVSTDGVVYPPERT